MAAGHRLTTSWAWRISFSATDVAYLAPQAADSTWYPYSFLAPTAQNEPWLGSALRVVAGLVEDCAHQGVAERLVVMGFSQGAWLTLEFAARHARRYAAVIAFTGGLIGPPITFDRGRGAVISPTEVCPLRVMSAWTTAMSSDSRFTLTSVACSRGSLKIGSARTRERVGSRRACATRGLSR